MICRQSRRIRIDRLQGIDIVQPLVARLFGLAELRMDVAGAATVRARSPSSPSPRRPVLRDVLLDAPRRGPWGR